MGTTRMVYFHLLHFISVKLLLNSLRQSWCELIASGRLRTTIICEWAESVIDGEIRRKCDPLRHYRCRLGSRCHLWMHNRKSGSRGVHLGVHVRHVSVMRDADGHTFLVCNSW